MESDVTRYFYKGGLNCAESTLRCLIEKGVIDAPPDAVRQPSGAGPFTGKCGKKAGKYVLAGYIR